MILTNFHTHCEYCDGIEKPEAYILEALQKNFSAIGFSSHAPIPFENQWTMKDESVSNYLKTIHQTKLKYQDRIEIYTGLEIDYFQGDNRNIFNKYTLDYTIGSVHLFPHPKGNGYYSVDGSYEEFIVTLEEMFGGRIQDFVRHYYQSIAEMLEQYRPDILGHMDIIKKNNKNGTFFDETEEWYQEIIDALLPIIKSTNTIVEVNTGGISRGYTLETYPSTWILKKCHDMDIPIIVTADAHDPKNIDHAYSKTYATLKDIGFKTQTILKNGTWTKVPL